MSLDTYARVVAAINAGERILRSDFAQALRQCGERDDRVLRLYLADVIERVPYSSMTRLKYLPARRRLERMPVLNSPHKEPHPMSAPTYELLGTHDDGTALRQAACAIVPETKHGRTFVHLAFIAIKPATGDRVRVVIPEFDYDKEIAIPPLRLTRPWRYPVVLEIA